MKKNLLAADIPLKADADRNNKTLYNLSAPNTGLVLLTDLTSEGGSLVHFNARCLRVVFLSLTAYRAHRMLGVFVE